MKKKIRQSVFETNSSSTHSICIAKDIKLDIPSKIHFAFGEFGWEVNTLQSVEDKASYLYTGLLANERREDAEKVFEVLKSKGIEVTSEEPEYENRSYRDDDNKLVEYTSGVNIGYVDHSDDMGSFLDAVCSDEERLLRYLFSPLSFIVTGNDNDEETKSSIDVKYPYEEYYKGN